MCGGEKYFSAIPYSTYDLPIELQWYWIYSGLSLVSTQPVEKGASIRLLAVFLLM